MTTQTSLRLQEIQILWKQYQGLYVVAGILIGLLIFPFLELIITNLSDLLIGLLPEAIGVGFIVLLLDRIYEHRDTQQLKHQLIYDIQGESNESAKVALHRLRYEGWLTGESGLLKGLDLRASYLQHADLQDANLQGTRLTFSNLEQAKFTEADMRSTDLWRTNLLKAELWKANLQGANLTKSNLSKTLLGGANLRQAILAQANLEDTLLADVDLREANLEQSLIRGVDLKRADLQNANLRGATIENVQFQGANLLGINLDDVKWISDGQTETTLPDGTKWTPDTDMARFTDPNHPDFWQPPERDSNVD